MARNPVDALDIDDRAEVRDVVEEVRAGERPRLLRVGKSSLAMIIPLRDDTRPVEADAVESIHWRVITEEARAAFRAAAGGWNDFDAATFLEQNRASRELGSRPPVDL